MSRGSGESGAGEFNVRMQANVNDSAVIVRPEEGRVYVSPDCTIRTLAQALGNNVWVELTVEISPGPSTYESKAVDTGSFADVG